MSAHWVKPVAANGPVGRSVPAVPWGSGAPSLFLVNPDAKTADLLELINLGLHVIEDCLTSAVGNSGMDGDDAWRLKIICQLVRAAQSAVVGEP